MDYKLVYTNPAQKDLENLDTPIVQRILKKLDQFSKLENPLKTAKKLSGFKMDTYRFRVGDYRVIFRLDLQSQTLVVLVVLRIKHRKEAYRSLE